MKIQEKKNQIPWFWLLISIVTSMIIPQNSSENIHHSYENETNLVLYLECLSVVSYQFFFIFFYICSILSYIF